MARTKRTARKQKINRGDGDSQNRGGQGKNWNRGKDSYDLTHRTNELFIKYYKAQGIVPEEEWNEFFATLQKNLPVTFRISGHRSQSEELLGVIKSKFFSSMLNVKVDDQVVPPPKNLTWYPNEFAWQLDLSRKVVRSSECFSKLHQFLVAETECGAISRQEAVSMIPPLVLDIKSHHKILDMCASPGSKTAQLIEYLHSDCGPDEIPTGFVMANDTDNKRCYLMVHQIKRLTSPCSIIVNHDGRLFPKIQISEGPHNPQFQMFDRILCDVPCSGDGTMRKNFDVWSKWHPLQGANMHGLQCKIARRGTQLLEVGGRLVYSTCSLNPAEDEAVICDLLRSSEGAMELVEVADQLPGLKFTRGISNWKVMTKVGEWLGDKDQIPANLKTQYKETIYPPTEEEAQQFHLDRCMRILPHHQDSGGFFVAVLQKKFHLPGSREANQETRDAATNKKAEAEKDTIEEAKAEGDTTEEAKAEGDTTGEAKAEEVKSDGKEGEGAEGGAKSNNTQGGGKRRADQDPDGPGAKKQRMHGFKEDPFLFMTTDDPIWPQLRDFFGLDANFPVGQLMYRSLQGQRTIYFVSEAVSKIARCNEGRVKFINMGVKSFSRSPSPMVPDCDFRMSMECLDTLSTFVSSKRKVTVNRKDAIMILCEENPFICKLSEGLQKQLNATSPGSTLFKFSPTEEEPEPKCPVSFVGWRGKNSVRCFGARAERAHMLMLFGEDINEINKRVEEKKAKKLAEQAGEKTEGAADAENGKAEEDEAKDEEEMEEPAACNDGGDDGDANGKDSNAAGADGAAE